MVNKFITILETITRDRGAVNVFAILKMDELVDRWTVVLSAPWVTNENSSEIFSYFVRLLRESLTETESNEIARIGIFVNDQHIVTLINGTIQINGTEPVHLENTTMNGFKIHDAYIFASNRNPAQGGETGQLPL